eukprot:gene1613-4749_t
MWADADWYQLSADHDNQTTTTTKQSIHPSSIYQQHPPASTSNHQQLLVTATGTCEKLPAESYVRGRLMQSFGLPVSTSGFADVRYCPSTGTYNTTAV